MKYLVFQCFSTGGGFAYGFMPFDTREEAEKFVDQNKTNCTGEILVVNDFIETP